MKRNRLVLLALAAALVACGTAPTATPEITATTEATPETQFPPAEIQNDEGGTVLVSGELAYTYPFFTEGVAEPIIILEDEAGFIDRNRKFLIPPESQVMGQITTDWQTSPFSYSIELPLDPQGNLRDVDQDGQTDTGVMVFAPAYWTNTWGDPFLERRDQGGGGWSSAYASTKVSDDRATYMEVYGGKYVVYAPDDQQGFPSGFGADKKLFTADDPIVQLPAGWTVVDMDSEPFTFDRSREPKIDLLEPESLALDDFSSMSYTQAFDAMLDKFRKDYAFTEFHQIDWDAKATEFRPRFEEAEKNSDSRAYQLALRDFLWSIPDPHIGMDLSGLNDLFSNDIAGGLGMIIRETGDGKVIVVWVLDGGPAAAAGIKVGAEVTQFNGQPISDAIDAVAPWSSPFGNETTKRLQQLRYLMRSPLGTEVAITYQNLGSAAKTAKLTSVSEAETWNRTSFFYGTSDSALPVEYTILDSGYAYAKINSFFDTDVLTIQLWERLMRLLNTSNVPGLILDMRQNSGGNGWLADQMAAYFFDEELPLGNTGYYDDSTGEFYFDPGTAWTFIPPAEDLRYHGPVVVLVGPACTSACEFFSYNMTIQGRARIIGQYPTAGGGGSVEDFLMPEGIIVQMTIGRAVDAQGNIHIEGKGIVPDVQVSATAENLIAQYQQGTDAVFDAAAEVISKPVGAGVTPASNPTLDKNFDLIGALQGGDKTLEDLARESYDSAELSQAGHTYTYTIPLNESRDLIWMYAWCTKTQDQLKDNWSKIRLEFALNGQVVPLDQFGLFEGEGGGGPCRIYYVKLSGWAAGENVLTTTVTFTAALNDGFADYPAGKHVYEYHVFVAK